MASKAKKNEPVAVVKTPADLQRIRLQKLMKNPAKQIVIPEPSKAAKMKDAPEFIRNVWGSSAGAGSGDFHVYRGVRRREYARQKFSTEQNARMEAEETYHKKVEENKKVADERTAKKRAKRLKKKQKTKNKKPKKENETGKNCIPEHLLLSSTASAKEQDSESDSGEECAAGDGNSNKADGSHNKNNSSGDTKSAGVNDRGNGVENNGDTCGGEKADDDSSGDSKDKDDSRNGER